MCLVSFSFFYHLFFLFVFFFSFRRSRLAFFFFLHNNNNSSEECNKNIYANLLLCIIVVLFIITTHNIQLKYKVIIISTPLTTIYIQCLFINKGRYLDTLINMMKTKKISSSIHISNLMHSHSLNMNIYPLTLVQDNNGINKRKCVLQEFLLLYFATTVCNSV